MKVGKMISLFVTVVMLVPCSVSASQNNKIPVIKTDLNTGISSEYNMYSEISTLETDSFIPPEVAPIDTFDILGEDERYPVDDTTYFPFTACGSLYIRWPNGAQGLGTAFLIDTNKIATADHFLYSFENGGHCSSAIFVPGQADKKEPFGRAAILQTVVPKEYQTERATDYDYAVATISNHIGSRVGYFGLTPTYNYTTIYESAGYPGDYANILEQRAIPVVAAGRITGFEHIRKLVHRIDTEGGQSGSPIYEVLNNYRVNAIHTNGSPAGNKATYLDPTVINILNNAL